MSFQGKVIAVHNNLPLRMHATPFLEARVISKLPVGATVDIEAVEGSWMCVHDHATGHTGWVDRKYIQELPPPQPDAYPPPVDTRLGERDWIDNAVRVAAALLGFAIVFWLALAGFGII